LEAGGLRRREVEAEAPWRHRSRGTEVEAPRSRHQGRGTKVEAPRRRHRGRGAKVEAPRSRYRGGGAEVVNVEADVKAEHEGP